MASFMWSIRYSSALSFVCHRASPISARARENWDTRFAWLMMPCVHLCLENASDQNIVKNMVIPRATHLDCLNMTLCRPKRLHLRHRSGNLHRVAKPDLPSTRTSQSPMPKPHIPGDVVIACQRPDYSISLLSRTSEANVSHLCLPTRTRTSILPSQ